MADHAFINRSRVAAQFTMLQNRLLNDRSVGAEALAVLVYLLSKPADWKVRVSDIQARFSWGRDKTQKVIRQLERAGFIRRQQGRKKASGQFSATQYLVFDTPHLTQNPESPWPENPVTVESKDSQGANRKSPWPENPAAESLYGQNTDLTKTPLCPPHKNADADNVIWRSVFRV